MHKDGDAARVCDPDDTVRSGGPLKGSPMAKTTKEADIQAFSESHPGLLVWQS